MKAPVDVTFKALEANTLEPGGMRLRESPKRGGEQDERPHPGPGAAVWRAGRRYHPRRRAFTQDDIHFLQAVAHLLAAVIERQRMEEQAREQQAELAHLGRLSLAGEMAAGLAHELNQPLGALTTLAGACRLLLRAQPLDTEHLADAIEQIDAQSQRAGEIIRRMRGSRARPSPGGPGSTSMPLSKRCFTSWGPRPASSR